MTPVFYDTHAHLTFPELADDLPGVLDRARAAGVTRVVCLGTDLESSRRAIKLAERFPEVFAAVGWHPSHVAEAPEDPRPALRELARHPRVVAIGETGLDFYRLPARGPDGARDVEGYKRAQVRLFEQHLEVAAETGLNAVVHQRAAFEEALAVMGRFADRVRGQFHCFADDRAAMERVLALGSIVSFTGILTYKNSQPVREALAAAPAGKFMLETDSPYLVPEPQRSLKVRRCEPAFLTATATLAAELRGCSLAALSVATCAAAHEFFLKMT